MYSEKGWDFFYFLIFFKIALPLTRGSGGGHYDLSGMAIIFFVAPLIELDQHKVCGISVKRYTGGNPSTYMQMSRMVPVWESRYRVTRLHH